VNLTLSSPEAGTALGRRTAVLTIVEASACINFSADAYQVLESRGPATVTVARSGPLVGTVTVQLSTADGTATAPADYTSVNRSLMFAPGVRSVSVTIPIVNDRRIEGTETVNLALTSVQGAATLGTRAAGLLEILDEDIGGVVQFGAATYTVAEGAGTALITVTRTGSTAGGATVQYSTSDGTAAAGDDYTAITNTTLTFGAGETTKTFPVTIASDATPEGVETVNLVLASPGPNTTTTLGARTTAVLRIVDDELSVQFSAPTYTVRESAGSATITVELTGVNTTPVTVTWTASPGTATAGSDYGTLGSVTPPSGTLTFPRGGTPTGVRTLTFPVRILQDRLLEDTETVNLVLSNAAGGAALGSRTTATLAIQDDDLGGAMQLSATTYTAPESIAMATITVTRSGSSADGATVQYATSSGTALGGTDFTVATGSLTFGLNETTKTFTVPITDDVTPEGVETFTVTLSNPGPNATSTLGARTTATVRIVDDEPTLAFSAAAYSVREAGGSATVTVELTGVNTTPITVTWTASPGTATAGSDYGPPGSATPSSGMLTFSAGGTLGTVRTRTFSVRILQDTVVEDAETITLTLGTPGGAALVDDRDTATIVIVDDEPSLAFSAATYTVSEAVATAMITVEVSGVNTAPLVVSWTTSDGTATAGLDYGRASVATPPSGAITFPAGGTPTGVRTRTFPVSILQDRLVEGAETVDLAISSPGARLVAGRETATLSITDDDTGGGVQFGATSYTVAESAGTARITVVRSGSTAGGATVRYEADGGTATFVDDYGSATGTPILTGTLSFGVGETTKFIDVPIVNDTLSEGVETVIVTLTDPGPNSTTTLGARTTTVLRIVDSELALAFSAPSYTVREAGGSVTITVELTGVNTAPVTVTWTAVPDTATAGSDYGTLGSVTPPSATLTFAPGGTPTGVRTRTFAVRILPDTLLEGPETLTLTLSNAAGAEIAVGRGTAVLTILDDDVAGVMEFSALVYNATECAALPCNASLTVSRTGGAASSVTVDFVTEDGTATAGIDYGTPPPPGELPTPPFGTVTFGAGQTSQTIRIPLLVEPGANPLRTFFVQLQNPSVGAGLGARSRAEVRLTDPR
jgi:HSP20 family molecular chaperone IbpA